MFDLSLPAKLVVWAGIPLALVMMAALSTGFALASSAVFLPTALAYKLWRKGATAQPQNHERLEPLIWTYLLAGTLGITVLSAFQVMIARIALDVIFPAPPDFLRFVERANPSMADLDSQIAARSAFAPPWQNWSFNAVTAFVSDGLVAEMLRYLCIMYACRRLADSRTENHSYVYIEYITAACLSVGAVDSLGAVFFAVQGSDSWLQLAAELGEIVFKVVVTYALPSIITAIRASRRDSDRDNWSWWQIILPTVFIRGLVNYVAFSPFLEGQLMWVVPSNAVRTVIVLSSTAVVTAITIHQIKWEWGQLKGGDNRR